MIGRCREHFQVPINFGHHDFKSRKVDRCYSDTFLHAPTSCKTQNMQLMWDVQQNKSCRSHLPHKFWRSCECLRLLPHHRQFPWTGGPDWPSSLAAYHISGILRGGMMTCPRIQAIETTKGFPLETREIRWWPPPGPPRHSSPALSCPLLPNLRAWSSLVMRNFLPLVWWLHGGRCEVATRP